MSTLFPYTTLFRSRADPEAGGGGRGVRPSCGAGLPHGERVLLSAQRGDVGRGVEDDQVNRRSGTALPVQAGLSPSPFRSSPPVPLSVPERGNADSPLSTGGGRGTFRSPADFKPLGVWELGTSGRFLVTGLGRTNSCKTPSRQVAALAATGPRSSGSGAGNRLAAC